MDILFLTIAEVTEIHQDQVEKYGGHPGIRDNNLLCSAVSGPEASYAPILSTSFLIPDCK
jgi:death-on-curing protein